MVNIFSATRSESNDELQRGNPKNSLNIFTFNPFGSSIELNNFTVGNGSYDNLFLRQNSNFQKYPITFIYTAITLDDDKKLRLAILDAMNASVARVDGCAYNCGWKSDVRTTVSVL